MILCLLGNTCVARSTVQSESNRMEQLVGTITSTAGHEVRESSNSRISKGPAHERLGQRSLSDGTEAKDGHLAVHDGRLVLWHRSTQSVYYTPTKVRVIIIRELIAIARACIHSGKVRAVRVTSPHLARSLAHAHVSFCFFLGCHSHIILQALQLINCLLC